jgi:hypothetical protein
MFKDMIYTKPEGKIDENLSSPDILDCKSMRSSPSKKAKLELSFSTAMRDISLATPKQVTMDLMPKPVIQP